MDILWSDRKRTFLGLPWSFTKYSLTEERLFIETGLFNKQEDEVRLYRITDVSLTRNFGQRMFGVGKDVKEMLSELVEKQRDSKRVTSREFIGTQDHDDYDDQDSFGEHV